MPATSDKRYERIRNDVSQARTILNSLVPDHLARIAIASFVAQSIATAHRLSAASWGISLFPHRVCVNVGRGAVIQVAADGALMIVTGRLLKKLSGQDRSVLEHSHTYSFVPDAYEGYLGVGAFARLPAFAPAHADLVERAARNRRTCFWPYAHSPSVPALLREYGHSVPDPDYLTESEDSSAEPIDVDAADYTGFEGRRLLRLHLTIERRPGLAQRKKDVVLRQHGRLACEVCGFDFERTYGSIGHAFAEVHHLRPLSSLGEGRMVSTAELAIVCANCHRMLHLGNPLLSLDELRARIREASRDV